MTSLFLAAFWALVANVLAMLPSRDGHWRRAYALIVLGIPLVGYVTYQNGPWIGMIVLAMGISVLRWPVIQMGRWTLEQWRARHGGEDMNPRERSSS